MASLTLENLRKQFQQTVVLDNLNLTVENGEFIVLVGPSGCGKSTVLRLIAGLDDPTEGRILMDDRCVNDVEPKDRDIAMVFQNYALYPHMTVYDNLAFGLKMRKTPKLLIAEKVKAVAVMLQLEHLLKRKPKQLSGGQRQRVALGRAIVRNPKIYLMDEPLSNLDAQLRSHTRGEIMQLHRQLNTTTLYVTHDQTEAMTMGDRMVVLNAGKIQQVGPPLTVYRHPANRFVASFLGAIRWLELRPATLDAACWQLPGEDSRFPFVSGWPSPQTLSGPNRLVIGLRPEHIQIKPMSETCLPITVITERVEQLGREKLLVVRWQGQELLAHVPPDWHGDQLYIHLDDALCFDADTEIAIR